CLIIAVYFLRNALYESISAWIALSYLPLIAVHVSVASTLRPTAYISCILSLISWENTESSLGAISGGVPPSTSSASLSC
ncbi:MAG TPA: hypothetical protein VJX95_04380, partial [Oscillospiraceae bacterium]|nr:hypothetical protein [Oscillospiraceae bacterium]